MLANNSKNTDRSKFHSWINWPNKTNRKCTVCGCTQVKVYKNSLGKSVTTYTTKDGVESTEFIDCIKPIDYNKLED